MFRKGSNVNQLLIQGIAFGGIKSTVKQFAPLVFPAQNIDPLETAHKAVLQKAQLLAKHHGRGTLIGVKQGDTASRFCLENTFDIGDNRRDATAGSDKEIVFGIVRIKHRTKRSLWGHQRYRIAHLQGVVGKIRDNSPGDTLDRNLHVRITNA